MLRRFGSGFKLRLDHFRMAENGGDDVVEVVRNPACKRSDHLHATRAFQPHRQLRPVALKEFAFDGIGYGVPGKPHNRHRRSPVPYRPEGVETHDASNPPWSGYRHAAPATHAAAPHHVLPRP